MHCKINVWAEIWIQGNGIIQLVHMTVLVILWRKSDIHSTYIRVSDITTVALYIEHLELI